VSDSSRARNPIDVYSSPVPKYMIVRSFDCGEGEMPSVGRRSRQIIEQQFPEAIVWEHSHVAVDDTGMVRTFCVYQAPDEDTLLAHSAELGMHSIESIHEIAGDVTPADFPPV
jgi:hypothetical protein